jgi:hypothetical protein
LEVDPVNYAQLVALRVLAIFFWVGVLASLPAFVEWVAR